MNVRTFPPNPSKRGKSHPPPPSHSPITAALPRQSWLNSLKVPFKAVLYIAEGQKKYRPRVWTPGRVLSSLLHTPSESSKKKGKKKKKKPETEFTAERQNVGVVSKVESGIWFCQPATSGTLPERLSMSGDGGREGGGGVCAELGSCVLYLTQTWVIRGRYCHNFTICSCKYLSLQICVYSFTRALCRPRFWWWLSNSVVVAANICCCKVHFCSRKSMFTAA